MPTLQHVREVSLRGTDGRSIGAPRCAGEREPSWVGEEERTDQVHLPRGGYFYARLTGLTRKYPVLPSDLIEIPDFAPTEWIVRDDATHGKSRTYRG